MNDDFFERLVALTRRDDGVDPTFAARLRARVERALGTSAEHVTIRLVERDRVAANPREPERNHPMAQVITPYLCVHDATAAIEWYRQHFGATVRNVIPWEGRVGHAEIDVAGAVFYLSDEAPALGVRAPERDGSHTSVSIVLQVAAVEEFVARAVDGGAIVQRPIEEAHGSRNAWLVDPFGHRWNIATPTYSPEEIAARRAPSEPYYMTLTTADVDRAAVFYGAVLGWQSEPQANGGRHVTNTEMPIGLRPENNPFGRTEPGQIEMWFTVRDFDDAVERVRVAGGTVVELNSWDSGREAICEDDQGVVFKLSEPAPGYER
ncbi:MAG TPA: VOC family protein [Ilumatobacteraceae bacterium]|nr:VOC family protein [Ilumatobacteraceae bacterium]